MSKELIPNKATQPAEWYTAVVKQAELADYGPSRGTMIIRPYGYAIWENIQSAFDKMIKDYGVENAYFPLLIPMSFINKEKHHLDGFAPELAVVTHGGGKELEEPLVIRPTSETVINDSFTKWVKSYRDLPIMINQWVNVVRWEKRTLPFLRTSEFLWQEGHTIHETHQEAIAMQQYAMDSYIKLFNDYFAIDGYTGRKSKMETFAGADNTLTFEIMTPSGKALQSCTSHDLGHNFAKAFGTKFLDKKSQEQYVWQTSWGISTRSIGGLIVCHGDDNGLIVPPKLAPKQVVIIPADLNKFTMDYAREIQAILKEAEIKVYIDDRDDERYGYKLNKWEVKGVPVLFKIGKREAEDRTITANRRDTRQDSNFEFKTTLAETNRLLEDIQANLLIKSRKIRDENTRDAKTYDEMKQILEDHKGFVKVFWNDNPEIEAKIKAETKAVSRCCIETGKTGVDFYTGQPATEVWLFAQSY